MTIDGNELRISMSPVGLALISAITIAIGAYGISTFGAFGLLFVAVIAAGIFFSRIAPYNLQTARVKATRVFALSTEVDGFEISSEAGVPTTLVWAIDIGEVTTVH